MGAFFIVSGREKYIFIENFLNLSWGRIMNWTKEMVLQKIQESHYAGKPLNYSAIVAEDEPLAGAARRLFRRWGNAVREAGFDYDKIKREAWGRDRLPQGFWTPTLIIEKIRERVKAGSPRSPRGTK